MAEDDKSKRRECPKCLKNKMVRKGLRYLNLDTEVETNAALWLNAQGREPLMLYTCKKCGYCELYAVQ